MKHAATYTDKHTNEISFPLGGIGTGSIGLAGNGRLIDWEIFNRPNKGSDNGYSHIAVKAEKNGKLIDARVLNGDVNFGYTGQYNKNYGMGLPNTTMAGFPHFRDCVFKGEYPIAELGFTDEDFPADITLTAFNPLIPLNDRDSSIPAAFFEICLKNTTDEEIDYSAAMSLRNPYGNSINKFQADENISLVNLTNTNLDGDMTVAADIVGEELSYQEYWYRGAWWDNLETYWRNFTECSKFTNRNYRNPGSGDIATLCVHKTVAPNECVKFRYIITWNNPNRINYWDRYIEINDAGEEIEVPMKNYYSFLFKDSSETAKYSLKEWDRLYAETDRYRTELFSSTLPDEVIEAVSATTSVLKTETAVRINETGDFFGWEGLSERWGSCEGTCTHVWNYAYAMAFLFPALERNIRTNDYKYNQHPSGQMAFRTRIPFGRGFWGNRACVDGQMGGVMKVYRDWKICGDDEWLRSIWDYVKKSIDYAWSEENFDRWDRDKDGVLEGRQHHTLDMELFGPSSWLEGFYLGALKAGSEMAAYLGDKESADVYADLFEKGKKWCDENLFNGEYFTQKIDLTDKNILEIFGDDAVNSYWNAEAGQIKYQIGEGCEIDQMLAQWHAGISDLGEIFDHDKMMTALRNLWKNNVKDNLRNHYNTFRIFALNDEPCAVICDYPEGAEKPAIPIPYAQESMHGFEYALAGLMLSEGMIDEGLFIIRSVRARYNGENRNPWNEIECGSNYARSMASYSFLPILNGFKFDMPAKMIGFDPIINKDNYKCPWSLDKAWGNVIINKTTAINVISGELEVQKLYLPYLKSVTEITVDGVEVGFEFKNGTVEFTAPVKITGQLLIK